MEQLNISQTKNGFQFEGFPDGVKIVAINGPKAKKLADLSLHKTDLEFADACLDIINQTPEDQFIAREALWRCAIFHFLKCFGRNEARFQLSSKKIYKDEHPNALLVFEYFKELRDKHLIHDENSYAQSIPGAIINNGHKDYKIEKITCFNAIGMTLNQDSYNNLTLLIEKTKAWVDSEFEKIVNNLTSELEKESHEELMSREAISYRVPSIEDISITRKTP